KQVAVESAIEKKAGKTVTRQQQLQQQQQQLKLKASKTLINEDSDSMQKKSDKIKGDIAVIDEISRPSKKKASPTDTMTTKSKFATSKRKQPAVTAAAVAQTSDSEGSIASTISKKPVSYPQKKPTLPAVATESEANSNAYSSEYDSHYKYDDDDEEEKRGRGRSRSRGHSVFRQNSQSKSPVRHGNFKKTSAATENAAKKGGAGGLATTSKAPAGSQSRDFESDDNTLNINKGGAVPSEKMANSKPQPSNPNVWQKKQIPIAATAQQNKERRETSSPAPLPTRNHENGESIKSGVFGDDSIYGDGDSNSDSNNDSDEDSRYGKNPAKEQPQRLKNTANTGQQQQQKQVSSPPLHAQNDRESRYSSVLGDDSVYGDRESDDNSDADSSYGATTAAAKNYAENAKQNPIFPISQLAATAGAAAALKNSDRMQTSKFTLPSRVLQQKRDDSVSPQQNNRESRYSSVFGDETVYGGRQNSNDDSDDSMLRKPKSLNPVATKNEGRLQQPEKKQQQQQKRKDSAPSIQNDRETRYSSVFGIDDGNSSEDSNSGKEPSVRKNTAGITKSPVPKREEHPQPQSQQRKVNPTGQQLQVNKLPQLHRRAESSDSEQDSGKDSEKDQPKPKQYQQYQHQQQSKKDTPAVAPRKRRSRSNKSNSSLASDNPPSLRRANLTETPPTNTRLSELSNSSLLVAPAPAAGGDTKSVILSGTVTPTESKPGVLRKLWRTVAGAPAATTPPIPGATAAGSTGVTRADSKKLQSGGSSRAASPTDNTSPVPRKPSLTQSSTSMRSSVASNPVRLSPPAPPATGIAGTTEQAKRGVLGWIFGKKPADTVTSTPQTKLPLAAPQQEIKGKMILDNEKTSVVFDASDASDANSDSNSEVYETANKTKPTRPSPPPAHTSAISKSLPQPQNRNPRVQRNEERNAGGSLGRRERRKPKPSTLSDSGEDLSDDGVTRKEQLVASQQQRAAATAGGGRADFRRERGY
ncbi:hypothetical protein HK100_001628, partial [Physocladia obscura]